MSLDLHPTPAGRTAAPADAAAPAATAQPPVAQEVPAQAGPQPGPSHPGTTVVVPPAGGPGGADGAVADLPRRIGGVRETDVLALIGALASSVCLTWLLFTHLMPLSGALGAVVVGYLLFLAGYALLVSLDESGPAVRDRVMGVALHSFAAVLLGALVFVVVYDLGRGSGAMTHLNFYGQDMSVTGPLDPLTRGGIIHGAIGTLIEIGIALVVTVPLGLTCAVFLNEFPGSFARLVRTIAEAMTALPSIVAGLFIYSTLILVLGFPKSGVAAALALSVMMLPIIIRAADVVLRLVPGSLREAALATGAGRWRTVWHVVLPTARSGLATAVILGTARGIGETSPVLLTAGYGTALNLDPTDGPMVSLPLLTFELVKSPEPNMIARGFGSGAMLLLVVLMLFFTARTIGGHGPGVLTRREQGRAIRRSRDTAERFVRRAGRRVPTVSATPSGHGWAPPAGPTIPDDPPPMPPGGAPEPAGRPEPQPEEGAP